MLIADSFAKGYTINTDLQINPRDTPSWTITARCRVWVTESIVCPELWHRSGITPDTRTMMSLPRSFNGALSLGKKVAAFVGRWTDGQPRPLAGHSRQLVSVFWSQLLPARLSQLHAYRKRTNRFCLHALLHAASTPSSPYSTIYSMFFHEGFWGCSISYSSSSNFPTPLGNLDHAF